MTPPIPSQIVTAEFIADSPVYVLDVGGRVAGYYGLTGEPPAMIVDKLSVAPALIGIGRGKLLWQHAVATAQNLEASALTSAARPAPIWPARWLGRRAWAPRRVAMPAASGSGTARVSAYPLTPAW